MTQDVRKKGMDDYTFNVDGVNEFPVDVDGDWFQVITCPVGPVLLRFDDGKQISRNQGQGGRRNYSRVTVYTAVAQAVVIALGYGSEVDARSTVNATITSPVTPALHNPGVAAATIAAGTQGLIVGADANMLGALIGIDSTQPGGLWICDVTAADGVGLFVEPGQTVPFPTQAAIYGFNAGAADVLASAVKFKKT